MRKPDFWLCENKGADQLCSNCTSDQHLCFRYTDRTISPLLINPKFQASSLFLRLYRPEPELAGNTKVQFSPIAAHMIGEMHEIENTCDDNSIMLFYFQ